MIITTKPPKITKPSWAKKASLGVLAILMLVFVLIGPIPVPSAIGRGDFRAYWSAAHLLANSQNFADPDLLLATEQEYTGWSNDYAIITWNPPWLLALLLPTAFPSFARASWLWLLSNIILIFTGSVWVWLTSAKDKETRRLAWVAPLIAFIYSPTLITLLMGQVSSLVFFGLAAFLYLESRNKQWLAGASLALPLVKPHLVYITLPVILLQAVVKRRWSFLLGLAGTLLGLTLVVFLFRPTFLADYAQTVGGGSLLNWETPTLGGILAATLGWHGAKLMGIVLLPLAIALWWRGRQELSTLTLVNVTLLTSVVTAPFGWGYDAVVLLIPLLQILIWLIEGQFGRIESVGIMAALLLINAISYYQRSITVNELYYFWLPLAVAIVYLYTWHRRVSAGEVTSLQVSE